MNFFNNEKRYNTLTEYNLYKYGKKVAKIALNGNFTCPNKDGSKGIGGCSYCSKLGSGDFAGDKNLSLKEQFLQIKEIMKKKWPDSLYMPYLQANSNTYAPVEKLKEIYEEVLAIDPEKTVGISIATRADCLPDDVIEYLGKLNKHTNVQIELGLQTANELTAKMINRCSTNDEFINACQKLRKHNIEIVVHIINGLPNETYEDMMNTVSFINKLDVQGIKIHSLLVLKNTLLAKQYEEKPFHILSLEEYVKITVDQITHLNPNIIIHRLAADGVFDDLIQPLWTRKKLVVMNEIDKLLRKNDEYQGKYYQNKN
ncbi:MAG: TIGR01212 family radical SAM protein [Anaeroplasma sp.]|nr:TIGR01212 family radical SAM protein [Anaeroplasma sp.]